MDQEEEEVQHPHGCLQRVLHILRRILAWLCHYKRRITECTGRSKRKPHHKCSDGEDKNTICVILDQTTETSETSNPSSCIELFHNHKQQTADDITNTNIKSSSEVNKPEHTAHFVNKSHEEHLILNKCNKQTFESVNSENEHSDMNLASQNPNDKLLVKSINKHFPDQNKNIIQHANKKIEKVFSNIPAPLKTVKQKLNDENWQYHKLGLSRDKINAFSRFMNHSNDNDPKEQECEQVSKTRQQTSIDDTSNDHFLQCLDILPQVEGSLPLVNVTETRNDCLQKKNKSTIQMFDNLVTENDENVHTSECFEMFSKSQVMPKGLTISQVLLHNSQERVQGKLHGNQCSEKDDNYSSSSSLTLASNSVWSVDSVENNAPGSLRSNNSEEKLPYNSDGIFITDVHSLDSYNCDNSDINSDVWNSDTKENTTVRNKQNYVTTSKQTHKEQSCHVEIRQEHHLDEIKYCDKMACEQKDQLLSTVNKLIHKDKYSNDEIRKENLSVDIDGNNVIFNTDTKEIAHYGKELTKESNLHPKTDCSDESSEGNQVLDTLNALQNEKESCDAKIRQEQNLTKIDLCNYITKSEENGHNSKCFETVQTSQVIPKELTVSQVLLHNLQERLQTELHGNQSCEKDDNHSSPSSLTLPSNSVWSVDSVENNAPGSLESNNLEEKPPFNSDGILITDVHSLESQSHDSDTNLYDWSSDRVEHTADEREQNSVNENNQFTIDLMPTDTSILLEKQISKIHKYKPEISPNTSMDKQIHGEESCYAKVGQQNLDEIDVYNGVVETAMNQVDGDTSNGLQLLNSQNLDTKISYEEYCKTIMLPHVDSEPDTLHSIENDQCDFKTTSNFEKDKLSSQSNVNCKNTKTKDQYNSKLNVHATNTPKLNFIFSSEKHGKETKPSKTDIQKCFESFHQAIEDVFKEIDHVSDKLSKDSDEDVSEKDKEKTLIAIPNTSKHMLCTDEYETIKLKPSLCLNTLNSKKSDKIEIREKELCEKLLYETLTMTQTKLTKNIESTQNVEQIPITHQNDKSHSSIQPNEPKNIEEMRLIFKKSASEDCNPFSEEDKTDPSKGLNFPETTQDVLGSRSEILSNKQQSPCPPVTPKGQKTSLKVKRALWCSKNSKGIPGIPKNFGNGQQYLPQSTNKLAPSPFVKPQTYLPNVLFQKKSTPFKLKSTNQLGNSASIIQRSKTCLTPPCNNTNNTNTKNNVKSFASSFKSLLKTDKESNVNFNVNNTVKSYVNVANNHISVSGTLLNRRSLQKESKPNEDLTSSSNERMVVLPNTTLEHQVQLQTCGFSNSSINLPNSDLNILTSKSILSENPIRSYSRTSMSMDSATLYRNDSPRSEENTSKISALMISPKENKPSNNREKFWYMQKDDPLLKEYKDYLTIHKEDVETDHISTAISRDVYKRSFLQREQTQNILQKRDKIPTSSEVIKFAKEPNNKTIARGKMIKSLHRNMVYQRYLT